MSLLKVSDLQKIYRTPQAFREALEVKALRGVSLHVGESETLAIVGESGCGKSTLAKVLMKIEEATSGGVEIAGRDLAGLGRKEIPSYLQMIFQDPYSSINPRKRIFDIIAEPLKIRGVQDIRSAVETVARQVGLRPEMLARYPHMLSGGQRQRVGIARALITEPKLIICDEPVSALDVSVQSQVLNLLLDLQQEKKISYIFISHDLGVVRFLAHRVAVMYLGEIVETSTRDSIFSSPLHPYTQLLLRSTPHLQEGAFEDGNEAQELPSPLNPPSGCAFHTRCPHATELCHREAPRLRTIRHPRSPEHESSVACHHAEKIP